ncbi:hypothetical protein QM306_07580 [Burkholderia cenocepacia]|nr:hypothetical protein [Burkholderia cenocepacia]
MTRGNAAAQRRVAQPAANDIRRPGFDTDSGRRCVLGRRLFPMLPKMAFAVSIDRRRIGGDIPTGARLIFPIPVRRVSDHSLTGGGARRKQGEIRNFFRFI